MQLKATLYSEAMPASAVSCCHQLFFDTVCTLCDMRYDIYHATIDGEATGWANQLFYIRPR